MPVMTMVETINHTLHQEMARDGRVLVFGQDVARNGGVFRATEGLLDSFGADRVVDTPLAEGVIIGTAVGLAAEGMVPVPEIQFLGFAWQAFHQLAGQLARLRYRSHGRFDAPVTVRAPFGGGVRTPELHSEAIEAQLVQCPGLKVVVPGSATAATAGSTPRSLCGPPSGAACAPRSSTPRPSRPSSSSAPGSRSSCPDRRPTPRASWPRPSAIPTR